MHHAVVASIYVHVVLSNSNSGSCCYSSSRVAATTTTGVLYNNIMDLIRM